VLQCVAGSGGRAVGRSVLQCVAVCCVEAGHLRITTQIFQNQKKIGTGQFRMCCNVLQCCSVLQCVAVCCSVLQCVAVCCSVFQCVAVCCSVLQCISLETSRREILECVAMCGSVWQGAAVS